jgi:hypothetical protein
MSKGEFAYNSWPMQPNTLNIGWSYNISVYGEREYDKQKAKEHLALAQTLGLPIRSQCGPHLSGQPKRSRQDHCLNIENLNELKNKDTQLVTSSVL